MMLSKKQIATLYARLAADRPEVAAPATKIKKDPFRSLISVMLSAQSLDRNTAKATDQLFAVAATPAQILALDEDHLKALIKPAGLYNIKARNIRATCQALLDRHGGVVPSDRQTLLAVPGVGRKSVDILMRFVYGQPAIAVDTHVHRLCNRTGLAQGKIEAQTAASLEARTPDAYRWGAPVWLVEFGPTACRARRPPCGDCLLSAPCHRHRLAPASRPTQSPAAPPPPPRR